MTDTSTNQHTTEQPAPPVPRSAVRARWSVALLFVNVTDTEQRNTIRYTPETWQLPRVPRAATLLTESGERPGPPIIPGEHLTVTLAPYDAWAWILRARAKE